MKIHKHIIYSKGLFESIKTLLGSVLAAGISAISIMIYSRVLGPEKFGEFSVGFALVMILTRLNDLGLNTTILKYASEAKNLSEKSFIYSFSLKIKLIFSLIIIIVGFLFSKQISEIFNFHDSNIILAAMTIGLATVYYEQLLSVLQSLQKFNQAILINVLQAFAKIFGAVILLIFSISSSLFVFIWYVGATFIPTLFWKLLVGETIAINLYQRDLKLEKRIVALAKHSAVGLIAAGIIENIDVLFLQKYLTTYEVGLYSGVSRISLVFALMAYSLGNVLYPRVATYKKRSDINSFIKKAFLISLASIVGFLLFIPFGKLSILLTIGDQYMDGISVLYLLSMASFIAIASIPFIALFYSFNANWYFSISGLLQLAVVLIGNIVFVPIYGLEAAAWTRVATRLTLFIFTLTTSMLMYRKTYAKST